MKQTKTYCDYCGKEITNKTKVKIKTIWDYVVGVFYMRAYSCEIGGDGCNDCYNSYKRWVESREKLKEWNK